MAARLMEMAAQQQVPNMAMRAGAKMLPRAAAAIPLSVVPEMQQQ
jgi:hypothetical protein